MPTSASDRNLLFGILALQMDFISRDQLIAAMHAWVLDKKKTIGTILREQEALAEETQVVLQSLVELHLARHDHDPAKSLAAVGKVGLPRGELEEIGDAELSGSLGQVAPTSETDDPYATAPPSVGTPTAGGTRFQILRPHKAGGLGRVYVARDEELSREVALKEIREHQADNPESRARFLREAQIRG